MQTPAAAWHGPGLGRWVVEELGLGVVPSGWVALLHLSPQKCLSTLGLDPAPGLGMAWPCLELPLEALHYGEASAPQALLPSAVAPCHVPMPRQQQLLAAGQDLVAGATDPIRPQTTLGAQGTRHHLRAISLS